MKKILFVFVFSIGLFIFPVFVSHAQEPVLQTGGLANCIQGDVEKKIPAGSCTAEQILDLINNIIKWGAAISGALALFMFVLGGIWMLFSAGNAARVDRGKEIIMGTSIALIFILGSWLLIDFTLQALKSRYRLEGGFSNTPEIAGCCYVDYKDGSKNTLYTCRNDQSASTCTSYALEFNDGTGHVIPGLCSKIDNCPKPK